jgi:hypothetical protein
VGLLFDEVDDHSATHRPGTASMTFVLDQLGVVAFAP